MTPNMPKSEPKRAMLVEALRLERSGQKPAWFAPNMSVARALARQGLVTVRFIGQRWWAIRLTKAGRDLAQQLVEGLV